MHTKMRRSVGRERDRKAIKRRLHVRRRHEPKLCVYHTLRNLTRQKLVRKCAASAATG